MSLDKFYIKEEVVIVTGGAGFLGAQHCEAMAEIGAIPVILDVNENKAKEITSHLNSNYNCKALYFIVDITNENELKNINGQLKEITGKVPYGLINNAAIDPKFDKETSSIPKSRLEVFPLDQWEKELRIGLTGAFLCSKVFGQEMANVGRGVILNISSDLGLISPDQRLYRKEGLPDEMQEVKPVTYSVIKHGLIGLTRYLSTYWAKNGVRCNAFAPGGVYNNHPDDFLVRLTNLIPMGRMADQGEYKSAIQFLMSDASSYMTGAVLAMDGGRTVL